jgi:integrase
MLGVQKMRAGDKRIEIKVPQYKGLTLTIEPSGLKRWTTRFRQADGSLLRLTLGPVDFSGVERTEEPQIGHPLSLAAAHRLVSDVNRKRALGHDFRAAKQRQKFERDARGSKTFSAAALDFVERHSMRKVRGWRQQARSLGIQPKQDAEGLESIPDGLVDRWQHRVLADIDGDELHALVREVTENGVPGIGRKNLGPSEPRARSFYSDLSKFFSWCVDDRRLKVSPMIGVTKPKPPASRERVLSDEEIVLVWKACDEVPRPFGPSIRLMLLTADRRNEVGGMRRSEFSSDGLVWTIPGERTKNKRPHVVPVSSFAQEILAGMRSNTDTDLVFTTTGTTPISGWSKVKRQLDAAMLRLAREDAAAGGQDPDEVRLVPWRLHDLRRTADTIMASLGIQPHIIEAVLNHISGFKAGVRGTYNRYTYFEEKKVALERWSVHLAGLVSGRSADVVPLRFAEA